MDPIHKKVLAHKTSVIAGRISSPVVLSGYLSKVFGKSDREEIQARTQSMGATVGTQTLLSLLEKRGIEAFPLFIRALKDPDIKLDDLAAELESEERRLRGEVAPTETPFRRAKSLPPMPEESMDQDCKRMSPPPPYSVPFTSDTKMYIFSEEQQLSPLGKQPPATENSSQTNQEPSSPVTLDSLVKDIPFSLRLKIQSMMNPENVNNHDWRGLASAMNMSVDEVRQMQGDLEKGKMAGLFDKMMHSKKTINDLLGLLKHNDVQRLDVIDEILVACKLPKELVMETGSSENQESDSKDFPPSVEESCKSTSKSMPLPLLEQESLDLQEIDSKLPAPSQVENDDNPKVKSQSQLDSKTDARIPSQVVDNEDVDTKPDACRPSQVEDNEDLDLKSQSRCHLSLHMENSHTISNEDEDDVFDCADGEVKKRALLISCNGNSKNEKQHDRKLRDLEEMLADEAGWNVIYKPKCKVSELMQTLHSNLEDLGKSGVISFVYLVGPTVHINGENYLLPADLKNPPSRADLVHSSLNINWLVAQLRKNHMQIVIVDGAHENAASDVNLNGVLEGLAPMCPPPNAVIAFPCHPGTIRKEQERLAYIESVIKNLEQNVTLDGLFDNVREELSQRQSEVTSRPLEFSITSSLIPFCLNPGDSKGLLVLPTSNISCHAIIVSNSRCDGLIMNTQQCVEDREKLRMALLKSAWCCEEICDKSAKEIKDELRKALNRLRDQNKWVMVYFMGYTTKIMDGNYFVGKDFTVGSADPLRSSVPVQWALDLMCEKLQGRKILILDDLNTCKKGLTQMTAPIEVMVSLPKGGDSGQDPDGASFTSNFARLLENKWGELSLEVMVQRAAVFDRHRLSSNLLPYSK